MKTILVGKLELTFSSLLCAFRVVLNECQKSSEISLALLHYNLSAPGGGLEYKKGRDARCLA